MEKFIIIINNVLQKSWASHSFILHEISDFIYNMIAFFYKLFCFPSEKEIKKTIINWNHNNIKYYEKNIKDAWLKYGATPNEYFLFDFEHINELEKKQYVTSTDAGKYVLILNDRSLIPLFNHKYQFYLKYKNFYKRDIIKAQDLNEEFITKHPRFFLKPEDGVCGLATHIITSSDFPDINSIKHSFTNFDNYICEELIIQDKWTAKFHPISLNTLRIKTITHLNGIISIFTVIFRMGIGNEITDNASTNGLMAEVDPKTGVIISDGCDQLGHRYKIHPDSNVEITGATIPKFQEAVQIVKKMAALIPNDRYISWDMALTNSGWVLVEANCDGGFSHQITEKHGCKKKWLQTIRN